MRALLAVLALSVAPAAAEAVTIRDIIELSRAGLPDDVLVAVIEADRTIFTLDADQILELTKAGVSETVLLKMLRTRRDFDDSARVTPASPAAMPEVVIIGAETAPPPVTVIVPQYFFVPVPIFGRPSKPLPPGAPFLAPEHRGFGRFINQ
jgi:hypothetical protein